MPYPYFEFTDGDGFVRRVLMTQQDKPDAIVVLHGGASNAATILDKLLNKDANISYYALNALAWPSMNNEQHWIQPWKFGGSGPQPPAGTDGDTDLDALRQLITILTASHNAVRVVLMGFSGGGSMTFYVYEKGANYNAFGPFSNTLHNDQLNGAGDFVPAALKPLMWLVANQDPNIPVTGHLTSAACKPVLEETQGCSGGTTVNDGTTCGKTLKKTTYTTETTPFVPYSVIDNQHKWYSCSATKANEALFAAFCRAHDALE